MEIDLVGVEPSDNYSAPTALSAVPLVTVYVTYSHDIITKIKILLGFHGGHY